MIAVAAGAADAGADVAGVGPLRLCAPVPAHAVRPTAARNGNARHIRTTEQELAIRAVPGAGRGRIAGQLLTESMLLSMIGGAAGIAVAYALTHGLVALDPLKIARVGDVAIDGRVLAFTAAVAFVTGVLFGTVPALHASRLELQPALKEGGRHSPGGTGWLRRVLLIGEVAASVVLVAAAMLLSRSFARLLDVDAGFNPAHVLTLRTSLPEANSPDAAAMARAYSDVGRRLRESPGVTAAGAVTGLPLASTRGDWSIVLEGDPPTGRLNRAADWQVVTPGYFEALGTPLRAGRTFTDADRADTLQVIVINDTMARRFWPGRNPLGRRLTMGRNDRWITVVGVVGGVRHRGLAEPARAEMYRPHTQFRYGDTTGPAVSTMTFVVRTVADPLAATSYARAPHRRGRSRPRHLGRATMNQVVADATSDRRLNMLLFLLLGGLALVLATVGVYGVVAYSVTQRTHEIGVRMAIGARSRDVARMVLGDGGRMAVAGVAIGSVIALAGARLIRGLLFEVSATDPLTFAVVGGGLLVLTLLASYVPARRATRVDPMIALRGA